MAFLSSSLHIDCTGVQTFLGGAEASSGDGGDGEDCDLTVDAAANDWDGGDGCAADSVGRDGGASSNASHCALIYRVAAPGGEHA